MSNNGSPVRFSEEKLNEVLNYKLKIPPYQRNYCWEEHHVRTLLNDLLAIKTESYFLGTIILHEKNDQEDNNVIYCTDCGAKNEKGSKFCVNCGSKI